MERVQKVVKILKINTAEVENCLIAAVNFLFLLHQKFKCDPESLQRDWRYLII